MSEKNFKLLLVKLLRSENILINFVDIGSRNGIVELREISSFVNAYGFEPNPIEFDKLISGKTDASLLGLKSPKYRSVIYSPYALADKSGVCKFYVTYGPGAAGMLEPDFTRLKEIHWKGDTYKKNFAEDIFTVDKVIEVNAKTLTEFAKEKELSYIDYLKIDVEGSEFEVLEGAEQLLNNVGVIKVEVCFIPFRKDQKLFSEVDLLLRKYGFDLLKYEIVPEQVGLKERTKPWSFFPAMGVPEKYGQPIQADAVYVNRSITDKKRLIAQASVLIEKNYLDEALYILIEKVKIEEKELVTLLKDYKGDLYVRCLTAFFQFLRQVLNLARRLKSKLK